MSVSQWSDCPLSNEIILNSSQILLYDKDVAKAVPIKDVFYLWLYLNKTKSYINIWSNLKCHKVLLKGALFHTQTWTCES